MPNVLTLRERRLTALAGADASIRTEARADGDVPTIVGYGAVFYNGTPETEYRLFDDLIERIMPGAFANAIGPNADIHSLFNHNSSLVLGRTRNRTLRLSVDQRGLRYEVDPPPTTQARDVVELLKRGDVTGSSFEFMPRKVAYVRGKDGQPDIRELHDVELFEVGPVTFPAYAGADAGLRADGADAGERVREELERWRRGGDVGRINEERARCARLMQIHADA